MKRKVNVEKQKNLIQSRIKSSDYNISRFILQNEGKIQPVKKNLFKSYDAAEVMNCARNIVLNYKQPHFTFNKMTQMLDDKEKVIKLCKSAVKHWRNVVDAYALSYKRGLQK